ncbi:MAG: glycosyltransferase family 2 protein [Lachnospiraceae bacterium]|nr:glycosyltransferase family 2 protein [Lachnospiraceae bacterium]
MRREPKISIIVPVYNAESFLNRTLGSIIEQTCEDIEAICVDDGSADRSPEILDDYAAKDKRIRVIHQQNKGMGASRNTGMDMASGEYLFFLDADDYLEPDALGMLYGYASSRRLDILVFGANQFDSDTGIDKKMPGIVNKRYLPEKEVFSAGDISDHIFGLSYGYIWNKMYWRGFIRDKGIRSQEMNVAGSQTFVHEAMAVAERIGYLDIAPIHYRMENPTGLSMHSDDEPLNPCYAWEGLQQRLRKRQVYEKLERGFVNAAADNCLAKFDVLRTREAMKALFDALKGTYLERLEIKNRDKEYFFNEDTFKRTCAILNGSFDDFVHLELIRYRSLLHKMERGDDTFPYSLVPHGSRIVIYGAGFWGRKYFAQMMRNPYCEVVAWVDRNYKDLMPQVSPVSALSDASLEFDFVLISVDNEWIAKDIGKDLRAMGIDDRKIIWQHMEER